MYYYTYEPTLGEKIKDFFYLLGEVFISTHTIGLEMMREQSLFSMIFGILLTLIILACDAFFVFLFYLLIRSIWIKIRTKKTICHSVKAKIIGKNYRSAHTTMTPVSAGKVTVMSPTHHPEQFNVTVQYKDMSETFDDEDLYNSCKKNDSISLILIEKFDKKGKLIEATLDLPE